IAVIRCEQNTAYAMLHYAVALSLRVHGESSGVTPGDRSAVRGFVSFCEMSHVPLPLVLVVFVRFSADTRKTPIIYFLHSSKAHRYTTEDEGRRRGRGGEAAKK